MFIDIDVDMSNLNKTLAKLSELPEALRREVINDPKFLSTITDYASKRWVTNFNLGGTIYGGWARLSPETERGPRPLVQTGEMYNYLKQQSKNPTYGPGEINWQFGSDSGAGFKFLLQHFGTNAPDGSMHIPSRKLVGFNNDDRRVIKQKVSAQARKFVSIYM